MTLCVNRPSAPPAAERPPATVKPLPKSYEAAAVAELAPPPTIPPKPADVPVPQLLIVLKALYVQAVE